MISHTVKEVIQFFLFHDFQFLFDHKPLFLYKTFKLSTALVFLGTHNEK